MVGVGKAAFSCKMTKPRLHSVTEFYFCHGLLL
jgi:hypothetical protein